MQNERERADAVYSEGKGSSQYRWAKSLVSVKKEEGERDLDTKLRW